jgi:hypothetical protein
MRISARFSGRKAALVGSNPPFSANHHEQPTPYTVRMIAFIILLLVVWAVLAILGFVIKGLFWLAIIGILLFIITGIIGFIRRNVRGNRS